MRMGGELRLDPLCRATDDGTLTEPGCTPIGSYALTGRRAEMRRCIYRGLGVPLARRRRTEGTVFGGCCRQIVERRQYQTLASAARAVHDRVRGRLLDPVFEARKLRVGRCMGKL